jgi:hypothetical protein
MSHKPKTTISVKVAPGSSEGAPFIYFDGVAAMGTNHGAIQIELGANVLTPDGATLRTDAFITAHLRCSPNAAADLRNAIDKALDMLKLPPTNSPPSANVN